MKKDINHKDARHSVEGLFSTMGHMLKNDELSKDDQAWLEKELDAMEKN